ERIGGLVVVNHEKLGTYALHFDGAAEIQFCENETNAAKLHGAESKQGRFKDGFHDYVVRGDKNAVSPGRGTKVAGIYRRAVPAATTATFRLRLTAGHPRAAPFAEFDQVFDVRKAEADEFYGQLQSNVPDEDLRRVQRQALAGVLWSKQYFYYDVTEWL